MLLKEIYIISPQFSELSLEYSVYLYLQSYEEGE